ncbi:hypothetical protein VIGAN_04225100 [Vigna angularis var. angularis]|uniref:Uncharacterized protein n=1 Tax=Vigna angularis var. angularis TaxID=157739 RepID=A0A0S3RW02_PHAAN|nr:hypothetical protein VIGAN_04225100 [Vigna angularis var. angularis]
MLMVYAPTAILKCHLYQDSASAQQTYPSKINNNVNLVNCKMNNNVNKEEALVKMVTLPHGLDHQDDRSDVAKLFVSMKTIMPALLPKLIQHIDASDNIASRPRQRQHPTAAPPTKSLNLHTTTLNEATDRRRTLVQHSENHHAPSTTTDQHTTYHLDGPPPLTDRETDG